jgi:hypothetical protein
MKLAKRKFKPLRIALGTYRHYSGINAKVLGVARHSETLEPLVVYMHQGLLWVRPRKMFEGYVRIKGKRVKRFTFTRSPHAP